MRPSYGHPNLCAYNKLAYRINDSFLVSASPFYRGTLYDLGAGESSYKEFFLRYADHYIAVDWVASYHNVRADISADLNETLPIDDAVADTVISISVLEHLREPQIFLNEAYRILKSGGVMILQVPFMWGVHEAPYDYFRYTRHGLEYLFAKAGFGAIEVHPQAGFWTMWTLKFNYQSARLICGPWLIRRLATLLLHLIWEIDQRVAPWLDKHWKCEEETASYFVVAKKLDTQA